MALGQGILAGKKTYIVAILSALGAVGSYLTGEASLADALQVLITAVMGATIRAGVTREVAKTK
jgi:hypothetical protein